MVLKDGRYTGPLYLDVAEHVVFECGCVAVFLAQIKSWVFVPQILNRPFLAFSRWVA